MSNSKEDWNRYTHRPTEKVTHRGNTLPKNYCQKKKETPEWILLYFAQLAPLYQLISWSESAFLLDATIVCTHCLPIRKQNHSVLKVAPAARSIIKFTQGSLFNKFVLLVSENKLFVCVFLRSSSFWGRFHFWNRLNDWGSLYFWGRLHF